MGDIKRTTRRSTLAAGLGLLGFGGCGRSGRGIVTRIALKAGEMALLFKVKSLDGETEFNLEDYRGNKPVILFFGSYT